ARASPADDKTTAAVVRNNTIYFPAAATGSIGISIGDAGEGSNYVIANNAIQFVATAGKCLALPLSAASYTYDNHNLCNGFASWEASHSTLASWQSATGFDAASLTSAPLFKSPPTDFTPAPGSPRIGAGDPTQAPSVALLLNPRPTPVSIGAFEP